MAKITQEQKNMIRELTRRANRRIERATGGQRSYLEHQVMKATGAAKFSAATKGLTYEQAQAKLEKLDKFLTAKTTKISDWKKLQRQSVSKANETLKGEGYNLTDAELADILEQIDSEDKREFYRAVNLVEAAKYEAGDDWEGTTDDIAEAIRQKVDAQEALEKALQAREERKAHERHVKEALKYRNRQQLIRERGKGVNSKRGDKRK